MYMPQIKEQDDNMLYDYNIIIKLWYVGFFLLFNSHFEQGWVYF